ncbi:MAG: peptide chain release factor N(5)-glutamine methyltransferase [Bacteroidales bacterium]|nr:peptide chain release factor N(5)-glutamine methyltransferase [Bacteroidales bacterium]
MNTRDIRFPSNRVRDILQCFHQDLDPLYGPREVDAFCELLFAHFLGWDRVKLLLSKAETIDQSDLLRLHWALDGLRRHRPVQHITGQTLFCGCTIAVNPDVLIPRPETEEMVQWCIAEAGPLAAGSRILDACTGSGCIAIALKRAFPQAEVSALDRSEAALAMARQNAENNCVAIEFRQVDLLAGAPGYAEGAFSLLVSNPPYVLERERAAMSPNVLEYEPSEALFVPDSRPLLFYEALAALGRRLLHRGGLMVVEINEMYGDECRQLLDASGYQAAVHSDFRGRPRWVSARLE